MVICAVVYIGQRMLAHQSSRKVATSAGPFSPLSPLRKDFTLFYLFFSHHYSVYVCKLFFFFKLSSIAPLNINCERPKDTFQLCYNILVYYVSNCLIKQFKFQLMRDGNHDPFNKKSEDYLRIGM